MSGWPMLSGKTVFPALRAWAAKGASRRMGEAGMSCARLDNGDALDIETSWGPARGARPRRSGRGTRTKRTEARGV
jgi:hypothetical protein